MASSRGEVVAFTGKYHGLGNRLRVTLGSLSLANWADRDFSYTWPTGASFGAQFDELWNFDHRRIPVWRSKLASMTHPYRDARLEWLPTAADDRLWQIRTPHALSLPEGAAPWGELLRGLRPVDDLAERVESFHRAHLSGRPYVGVMIRTHPISNKQTLEHSPLEWFLERMSEVRRVFPELAFFISCDEPTAQQRVLDTFDDTYALTDKGDYNTKRALRSSLVDLYLLAGSTHVIAPHYSSFPETALHLAGSELDLETSMTDVSHALTPERSLMVVSDPLRPHLRSAL